MNMFRLMLCLAGFAMYLIVKQYVLPKSPEVKPPDPTRSAPRPTAPAKLANGRIVAASAVTQHPQLYEHVRTGVGLATHKDGRVLNARLEADGG